VDTIGSGPSGTQALAARPQLVGSPGLLWVLAMSPRNGYCQLGFWSCAGPLGISYAGQPDGAVSSRIGLAAGLRYPALVRRLKAMLLRTTS
jgi:hypothetical protein